ncbi:MAG TPA: CHAT domain-containing protein [Archangium sp.]|jgi:hypothetical protein
MEDRIKVLFLASDPFRDRTPLRLDEEVRAIEQALRKGRTRSRVRLVSCFATRTRDLQTALMEHDPRIVHFAGHGGDGVIFLGDAQGRPGVVGKESLTKLFGILNEWIRVVILNGCNTLSTIEALSDVVDYTIGMSQPLTDASAIDFAEAFYTAIGMGKTVRAAFDLAVNQLQLDNNDEASIPVLRVRAGVDPAVPLLAERPAASRGAAEPPRPADGQVVSIGKFEVDDAVWENGAGSDTDGPQQIKIDEARGRGYTFRNGVTPRP